MHHPAAVRCRDFAVALGSTRCPVELITRKANNKKPVVRNINNKKNQQL